MTPCTAVTFDINHHAVEHKPTETQEFLHSEARRSFSFLREMTGF